VFYGVAVFYISYWMFFGTNNFFNKQRAMAACGSKVGGVVNLLQYSDIEVGVENLCTCPTLETYKSLESIYKVAQTPIL
jgi:hypothetical protein